MPPEKDVGDFISQLFVTCCQVCDRMNNAIYGSLYCSEMVVLEESHLEAYKAVNAVNIAVQRSSSRAFSRTATDQP